MALARLSAIKDHLKISGAGENDSLSLHLKMASAIAERYTRRSQLERPSSAQVEYYSPSDLLTDRLYLRSKNVASVTEVLEQYDLDGGDNVIASSKYTVFLDEGYIRFNKDSVDSGLGRMKITYTAGYDTTGWDTDAITTTFGVPDDLEYAVIVIASKMWMDSRRGDGRLGLVSKARGGESISLSTGNSNGMPSEAMFILTHYQMPILF